MGENMKKLRLLITKKCNKSCKGCCNKEWDLDNLPVVDSYKDYDEIMLTGGEPMLEQADVLETIMNIRKQNTKAKIYIYTAQPIIPTYILKNIDGLTVTLHEEQDVKSFIHLDYILTQGKYKNLSLRLNIFGNIPLKPDSFFPLWKIRRNMKWIENCPLPIDEIFMKLKKEEK